MFEEQNAMNEGELFKIYSLAEDLIAEVKDAIEPNPASIELRIFKEYITIAVNNENYSERRGYAWLNNKLKSVKNFTNNGGEPA